MRLLNNMLQMNFTFSAVLTSLLLVSALSLDALIAAFSYGVNKIKIPFRSVIIINLVCSGFLAAAVFAGKALSGVLSPKVSTAVCFTILLVIGLIKLSDSAVKGYIRKHKAIDKSFKFKFLSLKFILKVYADPETADADESKTLSMGEALSLAVALSLDSVTAGLGVGLTDNDYLMTIGLSFLMGAAAVVIGCFIGKKVAQKTSLNISWLSGVVFIGLAVSKLF